MYMYLNIHIFTMIVHFRRKLGRVIPHHPPLQCSPLCWSHGRQVMLSTHFIFSCCRSALCLESGPYSTQLEGAFSISVQKGLSLVHPIPSNSASTLEHIIPPYDVCVQKKTTPSTPHRCAVSFVSHAICHMPGAICTVSSALHGVLQGLGVGLSSLCPQLLTASFTAVPLRPSLPQRFSVPHY